MPREVMKHNRVRAGLRCRAIHYRVLATTVETRASLCLKQKRAKTPYHQSACLIINSGDAADCEQVRTGG
jgi:hypothetical protein